MKKIKKTIASLVACCAIVSSMGMVVSAADNFYFDLGRGLSDTSQAQKNNTTNSASVLIEDSTISNSAYMDFCVLNSAKKVTSNTRKITQPQYTSHFSIDYTTTPDRFSTVYLRGSAGYYSVYAEGTWTP